MREPMTLRTRLECWIAERRGLTRKQQLEAWAQQPLDGPRQITPIVFGEKAKAHAKFKLLRKVG